MVWAEGPHVPGRPTLLIYGHYDVQPPDPLEEWDSPPFEPTVRDGRLYARGADDSKGQIFCLLKAYEAVLDADGRPPLNVRFIFEGEEESGGRVIYDLLRSEPERTRVDAVAGERLRHSTSPGCPRCTPPFVGSATPRSRSARLQRDLHSGSYGGVAPNAIETLVRILAGLKDEDGEIRIPKLYKAVEPPTKSELKAWRKLPFDKEAYLRDEVTAKALTGLKDYSVFERTWALPTFEIHGIRGGFVGEGAKTVIPAQATAKVSIRLVPGQRYEKVGRQLERAVAKLAPKWADVKVTLLHGGDPVAGGRERSGVRDHERGVRERRGPGGGPGPVRRVDPHRAAARARRRAGRAHRHRAARRRAALPEREAGPGPALERYPDLRAVLRAVRGKGGRRGRGGPREEAVGRGGRNRGGAGGAPAGLNGYDSYLVGVHPLHRAGVPLGPGVQLVHPDQGPRRSDDPRHDVVGPVGVGPLVRGQAGGALLQVPDSGGAPFVLGRGDHRPGPGRAELHFFQSLQVRLQSLDHRLRSKSVRHEGQDRPPLGFLRLRQRSQVVSLVSHHLGQADADGPNRRHQRTRGLPRPAVGGPHDLLDAQVRLGVGGGAAG